MRLGQHEDTGHTKRLKLMECSAYDSQLTLTSNLIHQRLNLIDVLEVNTRDTSDEVLHSYFKNVRFFYTMSFTVIDNELAILRDGQIEYVFERDSLSRAAYNYMINWIQTRKSPEDDPGMTWLEAEKAWDSLSPEMQGILMTIAHKERDQARDIRDGLLATLHGYQGLKTIKDSYAECIHACFSHW